MLTMEVDGVEGRRVLVTGESVDLSDSQRVRPLPLDNTLWIVFCLFVGRSEESEGGRLNLLLLTLIGVRAKVEWSTLIRKKQMSETNSFLEDDEQRDVSEQMM